MTTQLQLHDRVRILKDNFDHDENDRERPIPAGSVGHVVRVGPEGYHISFEDGGWLVFEPDEVGEWLEFLSRDYGTFN